MAPTMSRAGSNQDRIERYGFGPGQADHQQQFAYMGGGPMMSPYGTSEQSVTPFSLPQWGGEGQSSFQQSRFQVTSPVDSMGLSPTAPRTAHPKIRISHESSKHGTLEQAQWDMRPAKRQKTSLGGDSQDGLNAMRTPNGEYECGECHKVRKRECDLR